MLDKIDRDKMKKQAGHDDLISQLESVIQMLKESGHTMNGKVSPAGKLYAKIDAKSIASSLSEKFGFVVDHNILKTNKIEHTGDHEIKLQFEKIKSSFILTIV
jgi:ribosomal protein L9